MAVAAREPFLSSTGARGLLAEEEERLFKLRQEIEGEARQELDRARLELEEEGRATASGKLCATPFGVDVVGITEFIALTGALVGGFSARQRKDEVERLNDQLRKINLSLRQQAKAGTIYAPGLTYAPSPTFKRSEGGGFTVVDQERQEQQEQQSIPIPTKKEVAGTVAEGSRGGMMTTSLLGTMDEEDMSAEQQQCTMALKDGKRLLKDKQGSKAMVRFEKALMLAKSMGERIYERRATRGLAAAARLQNQPQRAIEHLKRVLEISKEVGDHRGDEDVNGTIADILTGLGEFAEAAKFYDQYIQGLQADS